MRRGTIYGLSTRFGRMRSNNVGVSQPKRKKLVCGHYVVGHPVAIYPSRRELYACPVCKKLVKALAR